MWVGGPCSNAVCCVACLLYYTALQGSVSVFARGVVKFNVKEVKLRREKVALSPLYYTALQVGWGGGAVFLYVQCVLSSGAQPAVLHCAAGRLLMCACLGEVVFLCGVCALCLPEAD